VAARQIPVRHTGTGGLPGDLLVQFDRLDRSCGPFGLELRLRGTRYRSTVGTAASQARRHG
jgi:hypothetical protein